jgi:ABC-2 type transport system permease protein
MSVLFATIKKDVRILTRDKVGLIFMFAMPIVLAIVITAIQNSTFELVNDNKVSLLVCNKDTGIASKQLVGAINKIGMFKISEVVPGAQSEQEIQDRMHAKDALVAVIIPADFTFGVHQKATSIAARALEDLAVEADSTSFPAVQKLDSVVFYYHPVLQSSFRQSVEGALASALQLVQSKAIVSTLYFSLNEKEISDTLENEIASNQIPIKQLAVSRDGSRNIPNATQHNIPAWTVFAMFFVVISLGSSVVREKLSGSYIRLKTLPTSFMVAMVSKQLTYLLVTFLQTVVIFSFGVWLFPLMGLPKLDLPTDIAGLVIVSLICGWCAVSYAVCIGVFSNTQEQANGIGAVSVVLMAAVGGVLVPSFAMPAAMQVIMKISPLHWCLEGYYGLFLEGGSLQDILKNLLPLLAITVGLQLVSYWGLNRKNFI